MIDGLYHAFDRGVEIDAEAIATALKDTYPLSETMKEPIQAMREWAEKRARYASKMWRDKKGEARAAERWASIGN